MYKNKEKLSIHSANVQKDRNTRESRDSKETVNTNQMSKKLHKIIRFSKIFFANLHFRVRDLNNKHSLF